MKMVPGDKTKDLVLAEWLLLVVVVEVLGMQEVEEGRMQRVAKIEINMESRRMIRVRFQILEVMGEVQVQVQVQGVEVVVWPAEHPESK
jgi:hypothetical protein